MESAQHCAEFQLVVIRQQGYVCIFEGHLAGVVNSSSNQCPHQLAVMIFINLFVIG